MSNKQYNPKHHPDEPTIMDYSSGSLNDGICALIEAHISKCSNCSDTLKYFDRLGGEILEFTKPVKMKENHLNKILSSEIYTNKNLNITRSDNKDIIPNSLNKWIKGSLDNLPWKTRSKGLKEYSVFIANSNNKLLLYKINAGKALPRHSHEGEEVTLVLSGGFSDENGQYLPGDIVFADSKVTHTPVADDDGECIVAVVQNGSIRLSGAFGKVIEMVLGKI